jgi:hypothetical protein
MHSSADSGRHLLRLYVRDTYEKNNQNGYYDMQGMPRENLIKSVTDINRAVYTHTPHPGTAEELRALEQTLFETWDKYQRGGW